MSFPAFLDTCAVYGAALTDLLLELAEQGVYRPLWSANVLEELQDNLTDRIGGDRAKLRIDAMRFAFPDAEVLGYESLIAQMTVDPKDGHVAAAAVRGGASTIVTFNLKDFPSEALTPYDVKAVHPDEFLLDQLDLYEEITIGAVKWIAAGYESPPMSTEEYIENLRRNGVPQFADRLLATL
ncbi:MAG: hypothetical protein JWO18_2681 [Microbacteriaceae bacterium]|jgi:predicted nucleic acid-binding protein|nr:hypothetical protein [Microbacteriaceae bacterium]